jgi:AcrR family transcriptional regulator
MTTSTEAKKYRPLRPGPGLSREEVAADQRSRLRWAVIELVAAGGYQSLTVRGLATRARISSGAFYTHFRSTDDCFLSTYDLVCRRVAERLMEAGQAEGDPHRRLTVAVDRLLRDIVSTPEIATFMLRSAPASGPAFTPTLRNSALQVGSALDYCLRAADRPEMPQPVLEGLVAGLGRIGRLQEVGSIERDQTMAIADETAAWAMNVCVFSARDEATAWTVAVRDTRGWRPAERRSDDGGWAGAPGDDRAMILSAAFRIARSGYHQLTVSRICREAGVPRRHFSRYFASLEDCFSSALEQRVANLVGAWRRNRTATVTWSGSVDRALEMIRGAVQTDVDGARLLLVEIFSAGTEGMESRDRLISQIAQTVRDTAPLNRRPSALEAEASTAAAWAMVAAQLAGGLSR